MSQVVLRGVTKRYGETVALQPTDLTIGEGELVTLLGPSGCGKTTTLRMIAGFVEPSAGRILIAGEDVTDLPPQRRSIGMVFQDYALFPHLTIADNIGFGLTERGVAKAKIAPRVGELLELIRLPQIARRYPAEISGGQQQRVALARAIAYPPRVLLMDEPLGALDLKMREAMQEELRRIQRELRITTVYVTHDQGEAMNLSDTIVVMDHGRVIQRGTAREVYDRPRTRFVAGFVGQINVLDGVPAGRDGAWDTMRRGAIRLRLPQHQPAPSGELTLAIRPQHLTIADGADVPPEYNRLPGTVVSQSFSGNLCHVRVAVAGTEWAVEARPGEHVVADGGSVTVAWHPDRAVVLVE